MTDPANPPHQSIPLPWDYWKYQLFAVANALLFILIWTMVLQTSADIGFQIFISFVAFLIIPFNILIVLSTLELRKGQITRVTKLIYTGMPEKPLPKNIHRRLLGALLSQLLLHALFIIELPYIKTSLYIIGIILLILSIMGLHYGTTEIVTVKHSTTSKSEKHEETEKSTDES